MTTADGASSPSGSDAPAAWRLTLLGGARLTGPKGAVRLDRRTVALLAYLALEGETSKHRPSGLLWPDSPEATAKNNMRALLYRLRGATGTGLVSGGERIALSEHVEADAAWLQARAFAGEHAAALELTGELLEGLEFDDAPDFEEWLLGAREGLAGLRRNAAAAEAERLEGEGDLSGALRFASLALELDPLSEEAHRRVMRLHYLQGDRGAALVAYERCREVLRREFGAEPMPETQALAREVERDGRVPTAAPRPAPAVPLSVLRPGLLAGRQREWALLEEAWERGQFIAVSGEPGAGKSRLVLDFVYSKAPRESVLHLQSRPGDAAVPYSTHARNYRQLLEQFKPELPDWARRELARIIPELGETPGPLSSEADKLRFYQAKLEVTLGAVRNGMQVIVSDDVQFTDPASAEAAIYMMGNVSVGSPIRAVYAYREGELPPAVAAGLQAAAEAGVMALVELGPLAPEAVREVLQSLELPGAEALSAAVSRYTGGNPQFVLETVKHLVETGGLERGWPGRLPPPGKVGPLVARRLERLSEPARRLAWTAAVLGSELSLERAARVLEVGALDLAAPWTELEAAQVLRGEVFSHDLVFESTLDSAPSAVPTHLHRRAAEALAGTGGHPARVAEHWLAGSEEGRAVPWLREAARAAEAAYRLPEAADLHERAAGLLEGRGEREPAFEAVRAAERLLERFDGGPRHEAAVARLEGLARSPAERGWAAEARSRLHYSAGRAAEAEARTGLEHAAVAGDPRLEADLYTVLTGALWAQGRLDEALAAAGRANDLNERLGDPRALAGSLGSLGVLLDTLDRHREAVAHLERALAIEAGLGDKLAQAGTLNNLAVSQAELGFGRASLQSLRRAEALLEGTEGATDLQVQCLTALGARLYEASDYRGALEALGRALALVSDLGLWSWPTVLRSLAQVHLELGLLERAEAELAEALARPNLRKAQRAAILRVRGRLLRTRGEPALGVFEQVLSLVGGKPLALGGARLDLASVLPPQEGLALSERTLALAGERELFGLGVAARTRCAQALLALERPFEARKHAAAAVALLATYDPPAFYRGEVLFTHAEALSAAGDPEAAARLEASARWVLEVADAKVPPEHRESFLERNTVNWAILEATRQTGLAVPGA